MNKITELTQEQVDKFEEYVDKYTKIGLSTEPIDFEKSKKAINKLYECGGLNPPKNIVYCKSQLTAILTINVLEKMKDININLSNSVMDSVMDSVGDSVGNSVWDSVWDSVRNSVMDSVMDSVWDSVGDSVMDSVWDSVWDSVMDSVMDSVWDSVGDSVMDSVWDSVWDSVGDSVRNSVRNSVMDSVMDSVGDSVRNSVWDSVWDSNFEIKSSTWQGHHLANISAFYNYFRFACNINLDIFEGLSLSTETCGWIYAYEDICFVCDRHTKLNLDENGKLHSENNFAFQYPDGWGDTYWHGIKIPQWIIFEKEKLTIEKIFEEKNKEIQRCMIDIYGRNKLINEEGELIHSDDWGDLYHSKNLKDSFGKPIAFLKVVNFSPNETVWLTKNEIDKIFKIAQDKIGYKNSMRQGDVIFINKNSVEETKESSEEKIIKFKSIVTQEIELIMRKKNIKEKVSYKDYLLQVNPDIKTAYEALQSCTKRLYKKDYLPIIAS